MLTFILRFKQPLYLCYAGSDKLAGMMDTLACLLPAIDFQEHFTGSGHYWDHEENKTANSSELGQGTESKVQQLGCN